MKKGFISRIVSQVALCGGWLSYLDFGSTPADWLAQVATTAERWKDSERAQADNLNRYNNNAKGAR